MTKQANLFKIEIVEILKDKELKEEQK